VKKEEFRSGSRKAEIVAFACDDISWWGEKRVEGKISGVARAGKGEGMGKSPA